MKLVRGDDGLDWRKSFALMASVVMIEVVVIAIVTTHEIPSSPSPPSRILSGTTAQGRHGTELQVQAQDPDAVIGQLQIDWGDGHRQTIKRGCTTEAGARLYGGETTSFNAKHHGRAARVRVRPTSRSCIQRESPTSGTWTAVGTTGAENH